MIPRPRAVNWGIGQERADCMSGCLIWEWCYCILIVADIADGGTLSIYEPYERENVASRLLTFWILNCCSQWYFDVLSFYYLWWQAIPTVCMNKLQSVNTLSVNMTASLPSIVVPLSGSASVTYFNRTECLATYNFTVVLIRSFALLVWRITCREGLQARRIQHLFLTTPPHRAAEAPSVRGISRGEQGNETWGYLYSPASLVSHYFNSFSTSTIFLLRSLFSFFK
jgi:hypothetical protein